jgi:hypothetical protein
MEPVNADFYEAFRVRPGSDVSEIDNWATLREKATFGKITTRAMAQFFEGITAKDLEAAGMSRGGVPYAGRAYSSKNLPILPIQPNARLIRGPVVIEW